MTDRFVALKLFIRIARTGSFSAAGRELGLSQPSVSRIMASLERDLGVPLLVRSTRGVRLTEAGDGFLVRVERSLAEIDEAEHEARGTGELRGTLRIACSATFAIRSVIPALPRFTAPHPHLRVEFLLSDQRHDVISDGIDVALRVGVPALQNSVSRRLGVNRRIVVAAPAYLDRAGRPSEPGHLTGHDLVTGPAGAGGAEWTFLRAGEERRVSLSPRFLFNSTDAAIAAACEGLGVALVGHLACVPELERGALVALLQDWTLPSADVHLVLPAGRMAKPSARAFALFFTQAFRATYGAD